MHRQRRWLQRLGRNFSRPSSGCVEQCKKPRWRVGAFGSFASVRAFRGGGPYRSCPPQIFYWRLAPFPFTGRGWKLRSSSQRWTWCLEKRTFDSIRRCGMSPRIPSRTPCSVDGDGYFRIARDPTAIRGRREESRQSGQLPRSPFRATVRVADKPGLVNPCAFPKYRSAPAVH